MNLEIKKDLTSNWFKTLQESFCDDIIKFEKNKTKFKSTNWIRNTKVDEGGGEYRILQGGKIFEKGFIRAETISYEDFVANNGWVNSKTNGKMRLEGKDYIVKDGDVLNFRFNT